MIYVRCLTLMCIMSLLKIITKKMKKIITNKNNCESTI